MRKTFKIIRLLPHPLHPHQWYVDTMITRLNAITYMNVGYRYFNIEIWWFELHHPIEIFRSIHTSSKNRFYPPMLHSWFANWISSRGRISRSCHIKAFGRLSLVKYPGVGGCSRGKAYISLFHKKTIATDSSSKQILGDELELSQETYIEDISSSHPSA